MRRHQYNKVNNLFRKVNNEDAGVYVGTINIVEKDGSRMRCQVNCEVLLIGKVLIEYIVKSIMRCSYFLHLYQIDKILFSSYTCALEYGSLTFFERLA